MNALDPVKTLLLATLVALAACDEPRPADGFDELGDVQFRCSNPACSGTGYNSNVLAGPLDHFPQAFGVAVANPEGTLEVSSGTLWHAGASRDVVAWDVRSDGRLSVHYMDGDDLVKVSGEAVAGTIFEVVYTPDGENPVAGRLNLVDVTCTAGKYLVSKNVCTYTLGTDIAPPSPDYPVIANDGVSTWYATCPDDDNDGLLSATEKFAAVFNSNVALDRDTPDINPTAGVDMIACLNAAVAKPPYFLNVYFDYLIDPAGRALDSSQVMASVFAFMAWFDGESLTSPGHEVCFDDPIHGHFSGSACPVTMVFEGAYNNAVGQVCREESGSHRHITSHSAEYEALPTCTPQNYVNATGSPTIGVWSVPALP